MVSVVWVLEGWSMCGEVFCCDRAAAAFFRARSMESWFLEGRECWFWLSMDMSFWMLDLLNVMFLRNGIVFSCSVLYFVVGLMEELFMFASGTVSATS